MRYKTLTYFRKWTKKQRARLGLAVILVFADAFLSMQLPYMMSIAVEAALRLEAWSDIRGLLVRMVFISIGSVLLGFLGSVFLSFSAQEFGNDLRNDFYAKVLSMPLTVSEEYEGGLLLTRMVSDTQILSQFLAFLVQSVWRPLLILGLSLYHIALLGGNLAAWLAACAALLVVLFFAMRKLAPWFQKIQIHFEKVNSLIRIALMALRSIKVWNREETEEMLFANENNDLLELNLKIQSLMAVINPLLMLLVNMAVVVVLLFGGRRIQMGQINIGNILAMIVYIQQMMMCAVSFGQLFEMSSRAWISAERVKSVMEREENYTGGSLEVPSALSPAADSAAAGDKGSAKAADLTAAEGAGPAKAADAAAVLRMDQVSFSYAKGGVEILHDLTAGFPQGSHSFIVGLTGSGKSTLCMLLSRFLDPESGSIFLYDHPLSEYELSSLRRNVVVVPQRAELMPESIYENICYGLEGINREDVITAAKTAQADKFISRMERGYEEMVLQSGNSLSGGQRQCIAIARALVRNPRVLILDDCGTAMDSATEQAFRGALKTNYPDLTVISVSHRLFAAEEFDCIYVLEDGTFTARGKHGELMQTSEVYRNLFEAQLSSGVSV